MSSAVAIALVARIGGSGLDGGKPGKLKREDYLRSMLLARCRENLIALKRCLRIWRKGDKERIYVPRNSYEQAGYITKNPKDVYGRNSGEHKGFYYSATRPGNTAELTRLIDNFKKWDVH